MKRALLTVVLALVVVALLGQYAHFGDLGSSLRGFNWALLPFIVLLTLLNYCLRYCRWEALLRFATGNAVPRWHNVAIFLAGSAWIVTPARAGELSKSYYLRESYGTPVAATVPVVLCERIVDIVVMIILACVGLILYRPKLMAVPGLLAIAAGAAILLLWKRGAAWGWSESLWRLPLINRPNRHLDEFRRSSRALLTPNALSLALAFGLAAWGLECATFSAVVFGLGEPWGTDVLVKAMIIFPVSSLAGSLSLLPGGLGPADASLAGLSQALLSLGRAEAAATAILTRSVILGLPVSLGLLAMALLGLRVMPSQRPGIDKSVR